jgi:hypothetical protein
MKCVALKAFVLAASAVLAASSADAAPPADLADLVGVYAIPGQNMLKERGYARVRASGSGVVRSTFWSKDRACVAVSVANSRIVALDQVDYDSRCAPAAKRSPR